MMVMLAEGCDQSTIGRRLGRNRGTISRELARNNARLDRDIGERPEAYDAVKAQSRADALAHAPGPRKLARETSLFGVVRDELEAGWSPEQIAGRLKNTFPGDPSWHACHETIYSAIYIMPRGELRAELIGHLRQARGKRRPRSRGADRRGRISDMMSLAYSRRRSTIDLSPAIGKAI